VAYQPDLLWPKEQLPIPLEQLIACIERELAWRRRVFPSRVERGTMTAAKMHREMELMEAVLANLQGQR
jgi:hypothetical protein